MSLGGLGAVFHPGDRSLRDGQWPCAPCFVVRDTRVASDTVRRGAADLVKEYLPVLRRLTDLSEQVMAEAAKDVHRDACIGSALPFEKHMCNTLRNCTTGRRRSSMILSRLGSTCCGVTRPAACRATSSWWYGLSTWQHLTWMAVSSWGCLLCAG